MKIKLHHLNLCSKDVAGMEAFYRSVLDLEPVPSLNSAADRRTAMAHGGTNSEPVQVPCHASTLCFLTSRRGQKLCLASS